MKNREMLDSHHFPPNYVYSKRSIRLYWTAFGTRSNPVTPTKTLQRKKPLAILRGGFLLSGVIMAEVLKCGKNTSLRIFRELFLCPG